MSKVICTAREHPLYPELHKAVRHLHGNKFKKPLLQPLAWINSYRNTKSGETSKTKVFWGDSFNVVRPDGVSVSTSRYGVYEPELTMAFLALVKPGMTVYDVGAHFGYFSILASTLVGQTGSVISFEPTPSTFTVLSSNLTTRLNCRAVNKAAWSENSRIQIQDFGIASGAYNSVFSPRNGSLRTSNNAITHNIDATTLDEIMRENGHKPDFIKIDTESAEQQVIEGANQILNTCRPIISMELGEMGVSAAMSSSDLVDLICSFDYTPLEVKDADLILHQPMQTYRFTNLLFVPNESQLIASYRSSR